MPDLLLIALLSFVLQRVISLQYRLTLLVVSRIQVLALTHPNSSTPAYSKEFL